MSTDKDPTTYFNQGNQQYDLGNYQEAIEDYTQAIEIDPQLPQAYYNRGTTQARLGNHETAIEDYLELVKLTKEDPKELLYKYVPINRHQILAIINQELYFSDYKKLNDPLECFFIGTGKEMSSFGKSLKQKDITPRIASLTHDPESKLMYSHYASSHAGICVEYGLDFNELQKQERISYGSVIYQERNRIENLKDLYMLKNQEWSYEREYRLVRFDNKEFWPVTIKSITFGYKCSLEHQKIIYKLLPEITYYSMKQKGESNNLERVEISASELQQLLVDEKELFRLMMNNQLESLFHYFNSGKSILQPSK